MNHVSTPVKYNEKLDRNLFIYEFYTDFPNRKEDALDILADRYGVTRRRIQYIIAAMRRKQEAK